MVPFEHTYGLYVVSGFSQTFLAGPFSRTQPTNKGDPMDEGEPRMRRRGTFIHVETPELDQVEHESAEGISVRMPARKASHADRTTSLGRVQPDSPRAPSKQPVRERRHAAAGRA